MLMSILSIIANIAYFVVLNMNIYTDRAMMPTGEIREWHRSPIARLNIADQSVLFYLQMILAAVSIVTSVLFLFGVRDRIVRTIQLISVIGSTIVFIIILIAEELQILNKMPERKSAPAFITGHFLKNVSAYMPACGPSGCASCRPAFAG